MFIMRWSFDGSGCISYLKDYGSYYRVTVCKGIFESTSEWSDEDISFMCEQMHCNKKMAVKLLDLLHYDYEGFKRYVEMMYNGEVDEFTKKMGRWVNNLVRARSTIEQLGACNPWEYFVTFTISPEKYDRYDFSVFYKAFSKFCNNYKQRKGTKFQYVFVPEMHRDGAWHLHGLINGLPVDHLRPFSLDERLPTYIRDKLRQGQQLYEWPAFSKKFGYTIVEPLRDPEHAALYITKYIGKGFSNDNRFKNARLFMPSLGLKRAELMKKGFADLSSVKPSFDCEYATTYKFSKSDFSYSDVEKFFV